MKLKITKLIKAVALTFSLIVIGQANAGLIARDGGMLYDDVLNVTWLSDANYAKNEALNLADSNGKMTWDNANAWAEKLSLGGYNDWRLASYDTANSVKSELAHMFETNLALTLGTSITKGTLKIASDQYGISNLFTSRYWLSASGIDNKAWSFSFSNGTENMNKLKSESYKVWAVRDGDVVSNTVSVPEPNTLVIFALSLLALAARKTLN